MGKQQVNKLIEDSRSKGFQKDAYYLTFLKAALEDKFPGLGNVVLSSEQPSEEILDAFRIPTVGYQDYTVVVIDVRAFEGGGHSLLILKSVEATQ